MSLEGNAEYDRGWIEGSDAQNEADHEHIIKPLEEEINQLKAERQKAMTVGGYAAWTGKHILNLEAEVEQLENLLEGREGTQFVKKFHQEYPKNGE